MSNKNIYTPTTEELEKLDSIYCKTAAKERRWLTAQRAMMYKYAINLTEEYKKRKKDYLDKFAYFERNTLNYLDKDIHGVHNFIFYKEEVENKIKEKDKDKV